MIAIRQPKPRLVGSLLQRFDFEPLEVLPLLTMVLLLTAAPEQWYLRGPLIAIFAIGVVYRELLAKPAFWYVAATLLGTTVYLNWESSDNHKYLFVYWCLALCGSFSLPQTQRAAALAISSRWLIGGCMLMAVLWKLAMHDYRDGSFFEFTLLADERFAYFTDVLTGTPLKTLAENRSLVELIRNAHLRGVDVDSVVLDGSNRAAFIALAMTWWTVLIEGSIAAAFLAPNKPWIAAVRNLLLLLFATTTYIVAPVRGFGWVLMLLGLAQCEERDRAYRPLYLAAIVLIQIYTLPMGAIIERMLD
jgi:hypothetical protein